MSHRNCCPQCEQLKWRHDILQTLKEIRDGINQLRFATAIEFWTVDPKTNRRIKLEMALTMTDIQKCDLSIQPVDIRGNPAKVDGAPTWAVSDSNLLDIVVAADGLSATITAKGPVGVGQVTVNADADLGEGVVPLAGVLDVDVIASAATTLSVVAGTPVDA